MFAQPDRLLAALRPLVVVAALLLVVQGATPAMAAAPARDDDAATEAFRRRLLDAINARRDAVGTPRLTLVPPSANAALDGFLAETVPAIAWPEPCMHPLVGGVFSWDVVRAAGFGGDPRGEVLACPGPEPYWTPERTAEQWFASPIHHGVLYADGDSNTIACSVYGVHQGGGRGSRRGSSSADAASAVICVTFGR